jgi:polar amino acid transport system substrate-binding protein
MKIRPLAALAATAAVVFAGVAVVASAASIPAPAKIKAAGKIVYCTDATYPPEEFFQGSKIVGSDIDIGAAIAKRMGVSAQFRNTGFDGIIAALLTKKCDAIISGMNDTSERRKQVDFVDYLSVGQSLMVQKGNPKGIAKLSDLAGKSVAVEVGTTNRDFLVAESKKLVKAGKQAIQIRAFPKDTDAAAALKTGRVDAYFGDSPVVAYYIGKDRSFAFGGEPIDPLPVGIAIRKGDPLKAATQRAVNALYADGTMKRILAKWKMSDFALKG